MTSRHKNTFFEQLKSGLQDSIAYSKGELSLVTTALPPPPPRATSHEVQALRKSLGMSQAVFAATLNVSKRTVQSWEQGLRQPSDAALRMIHVIRISPGVLGAIFNGFGRETRFGSRSKVANRAR